MRPHALIKDVEQLAHGQRCRRLAEHGRRLAGRPELRALLDGLARLGPYERFLAVRLAAAARDLPHIARATGDPDPDVGRYAIVSAVKLGAPDEVVARIVRTGPAARRAEVYRAIRRHGRGDLAALLIDDVRQRWGDREAASLLPACPADLAAALLPGLEHAVPNWRTLARRHPLLVLGHAESALAGLPLPLRPAWWLTRGPGVEAAAAHAPGRVITLLEQHWSPRGARCVSLLLKADPDRTLALYLVPGRQAQLAGLLRRAAIRRRLAALPDDRLGEAGRAVRDHEPALINLLRAVAPGRREAVFEAATAGVDRSRALPSPFLLNVLPLRPRVAEARRMLGLRAVADDPARTLEITAFLPYADAEPALLAATRRSEGADRAIGYGHLIACAGRDRDPAVFIRLLGALGRLRNEQDPVRQAALAALAAVPPRLFAAEHVPGLDRLVEDALAARDCSYHTRLALARLATRVFEQGAARDDPALLEYGLRAFDRLTGYVGTASLSHLSRVLRRGQEVTLVRRLAPHLEAGGRRDRHELAFLLANALGRRGHDLPELQQALRRALTAVSELTAIEAIDLWLEPPRTRGERVAGLLAADPSTVAVGSVFAALVWHRTDLLDAVLGRRAPSGRFARSDVRQVRHVPRQAVLRWTARQRDAYVKLLEQVAGQGGLPTGERAHAVRSLGEIPGVEAGRLRRHLESDEALLRRAALTALPWTARPQDVLAALLARASGDDAHVAVYAAARAARFTPPAELAAALEPVLAGGKVTARKEAVRLLARHRAPGAIGILRDLWRADGQHKDVRVAIVSATLGLLPAPEAWPLLREAAGAPAGTPASDPPPSPADRATNGGPASPDGGVVGDGAAGDVAAPVLGVHPLAVPERWRVAYGGLVVAATRARDRRTRLIAVETLPRWAAYAPEAVERLAGLLSGLDETAGWRAAARGLVSAACSGHGTAELRGAVRTLAAAPAEPDAGADRDRPAAQRLAAVVSDLCEAHRADREPAAAVVAEVAAELPAHLAAELLAATVDWDDPHAVLDRLTRTVPGVLAAVTTAHALARSAEDVPADRVLPHAQRLAALQPPDLGTNGVTAEVAALLAVGLAAECGPRAGWPEPWRALLRQVRADGPREAAYQASQVITADE
ncbi:hypothetical protein [Nonomuraea ceibae]|uniref:hypothetical protein n=1 Tax=Nonomuraea ceibae TaxID=1935170 RepID=UPI001C5DADC8|nr:hypothetical protein [Nonomuraea ceibae]